MTNNNFHKRIIFLSALLLFLILAPKAQAISLYFQSENFEKEIEVGNVITVEVLLDTENRNINVLDGDLWVKSANNAVSIRSLSIANSVFSLWPTKPFFDDRNGKITFVGGRPTGLVDNQAKVLLIALVANHPGTAEIEVGALNALLNDGRGSKIKVDGESFKIKVVKNTSGVTSDDWQKIIADDQTPPESFTIESGQDPYTFNGDRFITFFAYDRESGIAYYEVSENGREFTRSNNTYVLQDQNKKRSKVIVVAYDRAGNKRTVVWYSDDSLRILNRFIWPGIIILIIILISLPIIYYFRRFRK